MAADSLHSSLPAILGNHSKGSKMQSASSLDFPSLAKTLNFNICWDLCPKKLDNSNYIYWKAQILSAIQALELEDLISVSKLPHSKFLFFESASEFAIEPSINEVYLAWIRSDQLLLCWLLSTISKSIMEQVH
ncbi:hypothetical protein ACOSQ4_017604 [Xanthoceras sorbifolium]